MPACRLVASTPELATISVYGMAIWRDHQSRRDASQFRGQSPHGGAVKTELGKTLNAAHIQVYGWISGGGNFSTNTVKPGGNWPAGYMYTPNTVQLDQAVMFVERLPDTVQKDHIDWGFRIAGLYGENYRYTIYVWFSERSVARPR